MLEDGKYCILDTIFKSKYIQALQRRSKVGVSGVSLCLISGKVLFSENFNYFV